jgi:hypothetical protein
MKHTEIKFYDNNSAEVTVKLKKNITANMIVEISRILKKYSTMYDNFTKKVLAKDYDVLSETDTMEFLRAKKYLDIVAKQVADKTLASGIFNIVYEIYSFEINKEIIPFIIDKATISNKQIIEMIDSPDHSLWGEQDVDSFREVCNEFYQ